MNVCAIFWHKSLLFVLRRKKSISLFYNAPIRTYTHICMNVCAICWHGPIVKLLADTVMAPFLWSTTHLYAHKHKSLTSWLCMPRIKGWGRVRKSHAHTYNSIQTKSVFLIMCVCNFLTWPHFLILGGHNQEETASTGIVRNLFQSFRIPYSPRIVAQKSYQYASRVYMEYFALFQHFFLCLSFFLSFERKVFCLKTRNTLQHTASHCKHTATHMYLLRDDTSQVVYSCKRVVSHT